MPAFTPSPSRALNAAGRVLDSLLIVGMATVLVAGYMTSRAELAPSPRASEACAALLEHGPGGEASLRANDSRKDSSVGLPAAEAAAACSEEANAVTWTIPGPTR